MSQTNVLITGANRGIGRGFAARFLALPNHTVIAANRNPAHPTSESLATLPKGEGSTLAVVTYEDTSEQDAWNLPCELKEKHWLEHLNIVVANAGIFTKYPRVKDVKREDMREHVEVNFYGMISLYQATRDLLQRSTREPIIVPISSGAGSMSWQPNVPHACYGLSKAMINWFSVRINAEDDWLNAFVLHPGFATTEMGIDAAKEYGYPDEFLVTLETSVGGMMQVLQTTTKEKYGGKSLCPTPVSFWDGDRGLWRFCQTTSGDTFWRIVYTHGVISQGFGKCDLAR